MRILRVAPWIYPDTMGGGEYHVHAMSRDQTAMGHDVTVLTTREDSSLPHIEKTDGYTIVRVSPGISVLGNDVSPAVAQYLWGTNDSFDVVHAHSHYYFTTNLAALKRRFDDVPLVITNHGLYTQNAPERIFELYLRTLGRWTFNQADRILCYTDEDKRRVRELGVRSQISVVSNGIDTERFAPEGSTSELIDAEGPVILFVGRLVDGKRPWLALEALPGVRGEYSGAELYVCGGGPLREELAERASELGVREAVTFLGHLPYDEMPRVYRSGDVLVLPSRAEGVPRTVLEAMASGIPVVTSDLEQVSGVIGDKGEAISTARGDAFADGVCTMLADGHTEVDQGDSNSYQWTRTVEQTTEHLQSLVDAGQR